MCLSATAVVSSLSPQTWLRMGKFRAREAGRCGEKAGATGPKEGRGRGSNGFEDDAVILKPGKTRDSQRDLLLHVAAMETSETGRAVGSMYPPFGSSES